VAAAAGLLGVAVDQLLRALAGDDVAPAPLPVPHA